MTAEDLGRTGELITLLHALNDTHAGAKSIGPLVESIPVLRARVIAGAKRRLGVRDEVDLGRALVLIGNAGLERVLFELLEELTILKADVEAEGAV